MPQLIYSIPLFLCGNVTSTTWWSEICNLTHLWRSSLFWNVLYIKPVMLVKMSSFTGIFQVFWPQMHLNLASRDFWSPTLFKPFYMTFEKLALFAQKFGINYITFSWQLTSYLVMCRFFRMESKYYAKIWNGWFWFCRDHGARRSFYKYWHFLVWLSSRAVLDKVKQMYLLDLLNGWCNLPLQPQSSYYIETILLSCTVD